MSHPRTILLIVGTIILIACIVGVIVAVFLHRPTSEQPAKPSVEFPIATSTSTEIPVSGEMTIPTQEGGQVATLNFIDNDITVKDPANEGNYYLAGSSGYCFEDGTCPSAGDPGFNIVYFSQEGSFAISLNREPLGEVRRDAEQYLRNMLGISETQMCSLNYYISTTVYVNSRYGSMGNLGFSFCPGAVALP